MFSFTHGKKVIGAWHMRVECAKCGEHLAHLVLDKEAEAKWKLTSEYRSKYSQYVDLER